MNEKLFFVLVLVCIFTHIVRLVYEVLKHKTLLNPNKLTFVIVFINMATLWTSWFALCGLDGYLINLPDVIRYLGFVLVVIGVFAFLIALFTIKTLESYEGDLITRGIYSKIRHPMYLGFILWLIGLPLFYGALFSFGLSLSFISNVLFWRYLEESELVKRYPSYTEYKKSTLF